MSARENREPGQIAFKSTCMRSKENRLKVQERVTCEMEPEQQVIVPFERKPNWRQDFSRQKRTRWCGCSSVASLPDNTPTCGDVGRELFSVILTGASVNARWSGNGKTSWEAWVVAPIVAKRGSSFESPAVCPIGSLLQHRLAFPRSSSKPPRSV